MGLKMKALKRTALFTPVLSVLFASHTEHTLASVRVSPPLNSLMQTATPNNVIDGDLIARLSPAQRAARNFKAKLGSELKRLARGNEGDAWVDNPSVAGDEVQVAAHVRHRQRTKTKFGSFIAYSITQTIRFSYNVRTKETRGGLCVGLPAGGQACFEESRVGGIAEEGQGIDSQN
jgi:hypothetical protein